MSRVSSLQLNDLKGREIGTCNGIVSPEKIDSNEISKRWRGGRDEEASSGGRGGGLAVGGCRRGPGDGRCRIKSENIAGNPFVCVEAGGQEEGGGGGTEVNGARPRGARVGGNSGGSRGQRHAQKGAAADGPRPLGARVLGKRAPPPAGLGPSPGGLEEEAAGAGALSHGVAKRPRPRTPPSSSTPSTGSRSHR
ncbi:RNA-binding protein cabeza-like [Ischnura elegans]|uniref:RNA-binding protein cabeza-like n=1 Tax=Ischnura elegans TaxID=197161 RepID=UPI001ED86E5C|nr:RNA-binding protein cabeza-like [Ischnura elegans]